MDVKPRVGDLVVLGGTGARPDGTRGFADVFSEHRVRPSRVTDVGLWVTCLPTWDDDLPWWSAAAADLEPYRA